VVAIRIFDEREQELPPIGMMKMKDAETGNYVWVNSSDRKTRDIYRKWWFNQAERLREFLPVAGLMQP
jgi:hypothetical protein